MILEKGMEDYLSKIDKIKHLYYNLIGVIL